MILELSALEQAQRIRDRAVSSEELVRAYLRRIERLNGTVQAYVSVQARRAIFRARTLDRKLKGRESSQLPLFYGVPAGIKDLVPVRGTPTRFGSRSFRYFVSPFDSLGAKRLFAGGLVSLGKLATSEFGALPITEPDIHPPTRNPWNLEYTSGGSSGGSGAAMAAGLLAIAHGSDGAGSIRIPSACCHVFGFKPSVMRVGNLHGPMNRLGLSVMGPLARTVEDAAAMLDVLAGIPTRSASEHNGLLGQARRTPGAMRIGMCLKSPLGVIDDTVIAATQKVGRVLEDLGHHVEEVEPVRGRVEEFLPIWQCAFAQIFVPRERSLQPVTRWLRAAGKGLNIEYVLERQRELSRRVAEAWGDVDMMLSPTMPILPPRVGQFAHLGPEELFLSVAHMGAFTAVFNVTGQPAASIPAGVTAEHSLPFAVQLAGRIDRDGEVLSVCRQLERAMPWNERKPAGLAGL